MTVCLVAVGWALPASAGAQDLLEVDSVERYYDVDAPSLGDAIDHLNGARLEGPEGPPSQGLTRYDIRPRWRALAGGGACRVANLTVEVRIDITLPRWPQAPGRPEEEQERWAVIEEAIRSHEYGHRDLTLQAARALAESLADREARGCTTLRRVVQGELAIHGGRLRDAHAAYDRDTPRSLPIGR